MNLLWDKNIAEKLKNLIPPWCLDAVTVRCFLTLAHECDCFQRLVDLLFSSFQSSSHQFSAKKFFVLLCSQTERSNLAMKNPVCRILYLTLYRQFIVIHEFFNVQSQIVLNMKVVQYSLLKIYILYINNIGLYV